MTHRVALLRYLSTTVAVESDSREAMDVIERFFSSHFAFNQGVETTPVVARISLTHAPSPHANSVFHEGDAVFLRKSVSSFFTIAARRVHIGNEDVIRCDRSGVVLRFAGSLITVHLPDTGYELELIELVRDVVFKHAENSGVLVLHSTVVARDGWAALIVGAKGAGKSTTAMTLAARCGFDFMSGDKAFVHMQGDRVVVSGWPDYPHVGVGTLRQLPELAPRLGADLQALAGRADSDKLAMSPQAFRSTFHHTPPDTALPVACVLYPRVDPAAASVVTRLRGHADRLEHHVESAFGEHSGWNSLQLPRAVNRLPLLKAVASRPAWQLDGAGVPDPKWFG